MIPTQENLAKELAERAMTGIVKDGKTLREWIDIVHKFTLNQLEWIPCSERLPETPKGIGDEKYYLACCESELIMTLKWCDGWNCHYNADNITVCRTHEIDDVIAWMPLPEPYKAGDGSD